MENKQTQFLADILAQIQALKEQIEQLETLVTEYIGERKTSDSQETAWQEEKDFTIEENLPKEEPGEVSDDLPDLPEDDVPPAMPAEAVVKEETAPEVIDLEIGDDFEVLPIGEALAPAKDAVMDMMAEKESWRTDMPGSSVNDIRSAISLNDRILFINTLFHEDPIAFKDTLSELNAMTSFEEGVKYLKERHPEWNTESDVVYRFMMAVRRKLK